MELTIENMNAVTNNLLERVKGKTSLGTVEYILNNHKEFTKDEQKRRGFYRELRKEGYFRPSMHLMAIFLTDVVPKREEPKEEEKFDAAQWVKEHIRWTTVWVGSEWNKPRK